jgi:hypothetical protein
MGMWLSMDRWLCRGWSMDDRVGESVDGGEARWDSYGMIVLHSR